MGFGWSFSGATIKNLLSKSSHAGNLGKDFAKLVFIVLFTLIIQLYFLRPKADNFADAKKFLSLS